MAPSALNSSQPLEKIPEPVGLNIKCDVPKTNPSTTLKGICISSDLQELNASSIDFNYNLSPKTVPEPNSPEVWSQKTYETANSTRECGSQLMRFT